MAQSTVDHADDNINVAQPSPKTEETQKPPVPPFPPSKTDKPRPHVCGTCGRSFARLEHLKRHERSHTKEKPFECPQCTRCFARRDLLLRHQQKLHQAGAASSRPRSGRRESTSGMPTNSRARKNSVASSVNGQAAAGGAGMRPRANTISHIDTSGLFGGLGNNARYGMANGLGIHTGVNGFYGSNGLDFRASTGGVPHHTAHPSLPKIDTSSIPSNYGGGLRTAPIHGMGDHFDIDRLFSTGSTINPAQLHSGGYLGSPTSPFSSGFPNFQNMPGLEEDDGFGWTGGLDTSLVLDGAEHALDGSSPSAISTASQSGFSEVMLDGSNHPPHTSGNTYQGQLASSNMMNSVPFTMPLDLPMDTVGQAIFPELIPGPSADDTMRPQGTPDNFYVSTPNGIPPISPTSAIPGMPNQYFNPPLVFNSDSTSVSSNSVNGSSARHSSVTSVSTDSITDATRQALIFSLSQPAGFGHSHRKFSQPTVSSPLSPGFAPRPSMNPVSLPSTADLQRYVSAYIHYFHPHMPFLHISTLSFNSPVFTSNMRTHSTFSGDGIVGGGGCLILAIAAIGALYEFEHGPAKELFESAKKMISIYLEERRKAGLTAATAASSNHNASSSQKTPLWLVQAMLLNLIYGHNCGDKQSAEIATTHCAALVSLAKAAELDKPEEFVPEDGRGNGNVRTSSMDGDIEMNDESISPGGNWKQSSPQESMELQERWYKWKGMEERKRTLFSVYVLSSLLVTAYNHAPRILNSELHLYLPCEEDLYAADSAQAWAALGGANAAEEKNISFAAALSYLLTASQRQPRDNNLAASFPQAFGSTIPLEEVPESSLKPSTFGCYILINALHVYIWETRQRHSGRQWKLQETEQMHAQIEPALRAWQSAWKSNPHHTLERPSLYGPLPADSIPLLDLAYVRLFVNLGRSKEEFFRRDFEAMARELGQGVEIIQHAEPSEAGSSDPSDSTATTTTTSSPGPIVSPTIPNGNGEQAHEQLNGLTASATQQQTSTRRERHLRKAAAYAADSLQMADKLGVTFAEFTSRELPLQAAMCTFDCAQVLAEWLATVQERVGPYLGILGRDEVDIQQVPAIVLLSDEDVKLLTKVHEILEHADMKMTLEMSGIGTNSAPLASLKHYGLGSRLLLVTAYMLEKAAVWPVTHTMARALETHAAYLHSRAEMSIGKPTQ